MQEAQEVEAPSGTPPSEPISLQRIGEWAFQRALVLSIPALLILAIAMPGSRQWFVGIAQSIFTSEDPAVECANGGGTYIDHGLSLFGPGWSCAHPPESPDDPLAG